MTLFMAENGRMAIHHECEAIHDIMTLFMAESGRMAIHHESKSNRECESTGFRV